MKIERPYWNQYIGKITIDGKEYHRHPVDQEKYLNEWFDTYVEPINRMLEGAQEVYFGFDGQDNPGYFEQPSHLATFRALVINAEPINNEEDK